ncbi:hypothetical protein ACHAQI_011537 [Fusarium lateritium]
MKSASLLRESATKPYLELSPITQSGQARHSEDNNTNNIETSVLLVEATSVQPAENLEAISPSKPTTELQKNTHRLGNSTRNALKASGLNSINRLIDLARPKAERNQPQVAIYKDRLVAAFACAIHLPPLVATTVMGYLIFAEHWVGAQITLEGRWDSEARFGLLVAAKLLEGIIIASLATMIFTIARYEAIRGRGAPLASFFAGSDFQSPSFLWSDGFMALLKGRFSSHLRKTFFILFIVACCLLAVIVAPATATVLLPKEDWYVIGGTRIWLNSTGTHLYNQTIAAANNTPGEVICQSLGHPRCPSEAWDSLRQLVAPLSGVEAPTYLVSTGLRGRVSIQAQGYSLSAATDVCQPKQSYLAPRNISKISMPHHAKGEALIYASALWNRALELAQANGKWYRGSSHRVTTKAEQVVAETICVPTSLGKGDDAATLSFPDIRNPGHNPRAVTFTIKDPSFSQFLNHLNGSVSELHFFDLPKELRGKASIGAVAAVPGSKNSSVVFGCLVNAQWHKTLVQTDIDRHEIWSTTSPDENEWRNDKPISVHASFANLTNLAIETDNESEDGMSIFDALVKASSYGTLLDLVTSDPKSNGIPCMLEITLNAMLVNGLARTTPDIEPLVEVKKQSDWWRSFFSPPGQTFGVVEGQTIYNVSEEVIRNNHRTDMRTEMFGFAYSGRDTTIRYSMIGLFVYGAITVCYIVWSVGVGITSSAWQSTPEVVILAMLSQPPGEDKMHTSILHGTHALEKSYSLVAEKGKVRLMALPKSGVVPLEQRVKPNQTYL